MALSTSDGPSISAATKALLQSRGLFLKPSSEKISETPKSLLIASGVSLEKTLHIN